MAVTKLHNVDGTSSATAVELVAPGQEVSIRSILISNVRSSNNATIKLFIQNDPTSSSTSTFVILTNTVIPPGTSLLLDDTSMINFSELFGLYITPDSNTIVDVFIN